MTPKRTPEDELARLLADDGGELGSLYRRLPRVDPPRRLDRAVLGEAARAVHGRPPRRQRWLVGFGSAAGLVLAAGVAWHVGQEGLRQQSHEPAPGGATYVPVRPLGESSRSRQEQAERAEVEAPSAAVSNAAPAAAPGQEADRAQDKGPLPRSARAAKTAEDAPKPAPKPLSPPLPPPTAAAPAALASPSAVSAPRRGDADAAVRAAEATSESGAMQDAVHQEGKAKEAEPAPSRAPSNSGLSPSSSVELRRDMRLPPQEWIARIEQLLHQGRRQQATESLQLFRRMHPDWQLSDELRALGD